MATDRESTTPPIALPANAALYLFTYAKSPVPLRDRLNEVATRATARFGAAPRALVVPASEYGDYLAAQEGHEVSYPLLPVPHLTPGHVGAVQQE